MDSAFCNKLLTELEDTYLSPLKNGFTEYSEIPTLQLNNLLYGHYTHISTTELMAKDAKLQDLYNTGEPLEILYMRLNGCVNYLGAAGETITKGNLIRIMYRLIKELVKLQEDCRTWQAKSEYDKNWMDLQAYSIEAQADLRKHQKTSHPGGYDISGGAHNAMVIQVEFTNMKQEIEEYCANITTLTMTKSTLLYQLELYANRLSTKEADNEELKTSVRNL